jgi:hypothetical protein
MDTHETLHGAPVDVVLLVQCTSPFLLREDIDATGTARRRKARERVATGPRRALPLGQRTEADMRRTVRTLAVLLLSAPAVFPAAPPAAVEAVLFDFEEAVDATRWAPHALPEVKASEPPVRVERVADHATSGGHALRLTAAGGFWPAVATDHIPVAGDWREFKILKVDVTVTEPSVVGFRVLQEKSKREAEEGGESRWDRTANLLPGRNEIAVTIHDTGYKIVPERGNVTTFAIYLYKPRPGQSFVFDHFRLTSEVPAPGNISSRYAPLYRDGFSMAAAREWERTKSLPKFRVVGTDLAVGDVGELGKLLRPAWRAPAPSTVEQEIEDFSKQVAELRKKHPTAVTALLRDGEDGYAGWRDTYLNCHGPDGPHPSRTPGNYGKQASLELFMRHRGLLMRADLSGIPAGSRVLAARLVLSRTTDGKPSKPNVFVAEPCARPWVEEEANCYEYAAGKFWKAVSGTYHGEDADFPPLYLAYGPTGAPACAWDFTEAVKYWVEGRNPNHGFFLHGDSGDYLRVHSRESADEKKRPALLVAYVP